MYIICARRIFPETALGADIVIAKHALKQIQRIQESSVNGIMVFGETLKPYCDTNNV